MIFPFFFFPLPTPPPPPGPVANYHIFHSGQCFPGGFVAKTFTGNFSKSGPLARGHFFVVGLFLLPFRFFCSPRCLVGHPKRDVSTPVETDFLLLLSSLSSAHRLPSFPFWAFLRPLKVPAIPFFPPTYPFSVFRLPPRYRFFFCSPTCFGL